MEYLNTCRQQIEALHCQVKAQVDALGVLEKAFDKEAEHLRRLDQAQCLDALRAKVTQQVSYMRQMESDASYGFTKGRIIGSLAKFAVGSIMASALQTDEPPLLVGAKMAANDSVENRPFGKVMVAVGPGGVPDDVKVIPLSRWAREQSRTEAEIPAAMEAQGYYLATPEEFFGVLQEVKQHVLKGNVSLPVVDFNLALKPADESAT